MSNLMNEIKNIFRRIFKFKSSEDNLWNSPEFDDRVLDHITRGYSNMEICEIYGIRYDILKQRLRNIAYDMYVERRNIIEIRNKTGVSAQELLFEIEHREGPDKSKRMRSRREGLHEPLY